MATVIHLTPPPRPSRPAEPIWDNIPGELTSRPRWVLWRYELIKGKWTKVPHQRCGANADTTNPATWATFDDIRTAYRSGGYDGIGIVLNADGLLGFDFDHVVDITGQITDPRIAAYVRTLDSYTEISPSAAGLRVFLLGTLSAQGRKRGNCECYDKARYLTVTGRRLADSPVTINERQTAVDQVHAAVFPPPIRKRHVEVVRPSLDDTALLDRARRAANGAKFISLNDRGDWQGLGYSSQSEADMALCCLLAFWTKDAAQIDRLFRLSALMREKSDRDGYRTDTINKALVLSTESYAAHQPNGRSRGDKPREPGDEPREPGNEPQQQPAIDSAEADIFVANCLFAAHSKDVLFCPGLGWLIWDETRWVKDDTQQIITRVTDTVSRFLFRAKADVAEFEEKWKTVIKQYSKIERMRGALAVLAPKRAVRPDELDRDVFLLNVANGTIDLRTGQLRPHSRDDRITKLIPIDYDPGAPAPRWYKFLTEIFDGDLAVAEYMKRLVGYSFTGSQAEQMMAIFWGEGSNGKGVLANVLKRCGGDYYGTANISLLLATNHEQHPTAIAALFGKRFVLVDESPENGKLNAEKVKNLTGNSTIHARYMRQDFFDFDPTHHLSLLTNHKPKILDPGHAIWRRLKLIPFLVKFEEPTEENPEPAHLIDRKLEDKLAEELPGILRWIVEGAVESSKHGLGEPPDAVKTATRDYRHEEDVLAQFVEDRCVVGPEHSELTSRLYAAYKDWAVAGGEKYPWKSNMFSRRLTNAGFRENPGHSKGRARLGIKLRFNPDPDERAQ